MARMTTLMTRGVLVAILGLATLGSTIVMPERAEAASSIAVVVNGEPITTYQIRQRAAFLKRRQRVSIPDEAVNAAYANFAKGNKLTEAQLGQVLSRAGFSSDGFKDYIRVQMGWGQAVQKRVRSTERLSEQDVVQRMLAEGGKKPTTTEYTLQQVIFVIPDGQRGALLGNRKREAEAMRARFQSCESTYQVAGGLRDVTVRDLGRVAQPELPGMWKDAVMQTSPGRTTPAKETERGVEFIAVCQARKISDDKAAAMVFQARELEALNDSDKGPDAKVLADLRKEAQIVRK